MKLLALSLVVLSLSPALFADESPTAEEIHVPYKTIYCAGKLKSLAHSEAGKQIHFSLREFQGMIEKIQGGLYQKLSKRQKTRLDALELWDNPSHVYVEGPSNTKDDLIRLGFDAKRLKSLEESIVKPSTDRLVTTHEIRGKDKILAQLANISKTSSEIEKSIEGKEFDEVIEGEVNKLVESDKVYQANVAKIKKNRNIGLVMLLLSITYHFSTLHMHTPLLLDFLNGLMWWQGWMRATEPTPPFIAEQDNTATAQYSVFERIKSKLSKPPVAGDYVHYGWMMPINNSFSRLLIDIDHPNADFKNDLITATKDLIEGNYEDDARKLYMDTIFYYDQQIGEPVLILVSRNEKTLTLPPKDDDAEKDHLKDAKREEKWQLEPLPVPSH